LVFRFQTMCVLTYPSCTCSFRIHVQFQVAERFLWHAVVYLPLHQR
jgi:hypothetical protein